MSNQELFSQRGAGLVDGTVTAHVGEQTGNDLRPELLVTHTLRGEGFDASEDGAGRGTPLVAVPILEVGKRTGVSTTDVRAGSGIGEDGDPMFTLQRGAQHAVAVCFSGRERGDDGRGYGRPPQVFENGVVGSLDTVKPHNVAMVHWQQGGGEVEDNVSGALRANAEHSYQFARIQSTVRRLTPRECERLQGFPDDHTAVQYRNKPACDGPRYKALGNSMAVPCVEFILRNLLLTSSSEARP